MNRKSLLLAALVAIGAGLVAIGAGYITGCDSTSARTTAQTSKTIPDPGPPPDQGASRKPGI